MVYVISTMGEAEVVESFPNGIALGKSIQILTHLPHSCYLRSNFILPNEFLSC
jgi:hypothetical protein